MKIQQGFKIFSVGVQDLGFVTAAGAQASQVFGSLAETIGISTAALGGFLAIAAGIVAVVAIVDLVTESFDEAVEKADKSRSAYEQTASEVESLESRLSEVKDRINELNSMDSLTITEEAELQKLQAENDQLERQLAIKQKLANYTFLLILVCIGDRSVICFLTKFILYIEI